MDMKRLEDNMNNSINLACKVVDHKCEWLKAKLCMVCGKDVDNIPNCPMLGKREYEGIACFDKAAGTYVLVNRYPKNYVNKDHDNIVFNGDMLMKYYGQKVRITVEVIND